MANVTQPNGSMTLGQRVQAARTALGLSQAALGQKVGLSQAKVSCIERDTQSTSPAILKALGDALGVNLEGLEERPTETPSPSPAPPAAPRATIGARPRPRPKATRTGTVSAMPRVTLYVEPEVKALLDAAANVTGTPAYKLLGDAFIRSLEGLSPEDRALVEKLAKRRTV